MAEAFTDGFFKFASNGAHEGSGWLTAPTVVSFLVLPVVMLDMLVFSNRFVGPVYKLTRHLNELADNERPPEIYFRAGDYFTDIPEAVNRIRRQLDEARSSLEQGIKSNESSNQNEEACQLA